MYVSRVGEIWKRENSKGGISHIHIYQRNLMYATFFSISGERVLQNGTVVEHFPLNKSFFSEILEKKGE